MKTVISNYGSPEPREDGKTFRVTPLVMAVGESRYEIDWYDTNRGEVFFDLPLNGEWSDLSAILDFKVSDDVLVFQLNDIHVL